MGFSVVMSADMVAVDPGSTAPLGITVQNEGAEPVTFELILEGIDAEWLAVPVSTVTVPPGQSSQEKVFFRPPRTSESIADSYPFLVRVRSLESAEERTAQGVLEIRPYHHLAIELNPKKGTISPTRYGNRFDATVMNLGNTPQTVRLTGNDPGDELLYEIDPPDVMLAPGGQRDVRVEAKPKSMGIVRSARLIGFNVVGRSVENPSIAASGQAQLEQRSLFSPGSLGVLLFGLLLCFLWWMNLPKPPPIPRFSASTNEVVAGEEVTLSWSAPESSIVRLSADGSEIGRLPQPNGSTVYRIPAEFASDKITFAVMGERNGRMSEAAQLVVSVRRPEIVPDPVIVGLSADPKRVRLGTPFVLRYSFRNVEKAMVSPMGKDLDPNAPSISIEPELVGKQDITVVAYNKAGKSVRKSVAIEVFESSDANILALTATPMKVTDEERNTRVEWQVTTAARVELLVNGVPVNGGTVPLSGTAEVPVTRKTLIILNAFDEKGRKVTKQIVVEHQPAPVAPDPGITPSDPGLGPPPDDGGNQGTSNSGSNSGNTGG